MGNHLAEVNPKGISFEGVWILAEPIMTSRHMYERLNFGFQEEKTIEKEKKRLWLVTFVLLQFYLQPKLDYSLQQGMYCLRIVHLGYLFFGIFRPGRIRHQEKLTFGS